jgi:hypothetical protein
LLTRNHRQEALCRAYVQAIAARCGMSWSVSNPDYGIDLTMNDIEAAGNRRVESGYKLDIQAKSTTRAGAADTYIRYELQVHAYEALRHPLPGCPRILVVLVLPRDEIRWSTQTEEELILRHCAYWLSLKGRGATTNRRSVRISIPRVNIFSVEALQGIMSRIKTGEEL